MGHSSYVYSYRDNSEILKNTESREYPKTDQNHNEQKREREREK